MNREDREHCLQLARGAITEVLRGGQAPAMPRLDENDPLARTGACFVTLTLHGELRGCMGTLEPHRPLAADIIANALAAAFQDPRFPPLDIKEWPHTHLSLSVLGPKLPLVPGERQSLLAQLRPGEDGLIIESPDGRRATFLPSVWAQLPDPGAFLDHLKCKAGLAANYDERQLKAWRYRTESFPDDTE